MTFKRITIGLFAATLALSACAKPGDRVKFNGKYYPAKVKKVGDSRETFVVSVQRAEQGIEGARQAGEFEAITYCVEKFGDSTIAWEHGQDADTAVLQTEGGRLTMRGSCVKW